MAEQLETLLQQGGQFIRALDRLEPGQRRELFSKVLPFVKDILEPVPQVLLDQKESVGGAALAGSLIQGKTKALRAGLDWASATKASKKINSKAVRQGELLPKPKSFAETGVWSDVYHASESKVGFDAFKKKVSENPLDGLGPHVGTKRAAAERAYTNATGMLPRRTYSGEISPGADDFDVFTRKPHLSTEKIGGHTLPLKARTSKPFLNGDDPWTEHELITLVDSLTATQGGVKAAQVALRKDLAERGFTHIPYINDVEDPGSISMIMLTDRPGSSPAVLRSRFAKFDPKKKTSENLLASGAAATIMAGGTAQEWRNGR